MPASQVRPPHACWRSTFHQDVRRLVAVASFLLGAADARLNSRNPCAQFYDIIGQNDGTLDVSRTIVAETWAAFSERSQQRSCGQVAIWDEHLGYFWGLVRIDAGFVGRPGIANANPRRTGRFTTPDMRSNFTPVRTRSECCHS